MNIKLELTVDECNMILRVLGKHPFEEVVAVINKIKVLAFKEKNEWDLVPKYNIGKKITAK